MASQAVNINSFANYIVSVSTYYDGTALSEENKTQLKAYLLDGVANPSQVLNVGTAIGILQSLRMDLGKTPVQVSVSNGSVGSALSVNSAKDLCSKMCSDIFNRFTTLAKWYTGDYNSTYGFYDITTFYNGSELGGSLIRIDGSSQSSLKISGTLIGGGGGASGAIAGDGDKNASYTITSGAGARGESSYLELNGNTNYSASGGEGGSAVSVTAGANPEISQAGNSGANGSVTNTITYINPKDVLKITCGRGGGAGAGIAASAGGTTGAKSWTAGSGSGVNGGSVVTTAAEWSSEDVVSAQSGGGAGGWVGSYGLAGNVSYYAGPSSQTGLINASDGRTNGKGGYGNNVDQANQSRNAIGSGGLGGTASFIVDQRACAYGGCGGNRGGFIVDSTCSAANCLMGIQG